MPIGNEDIYIKLIIRMNIYSGLHNQPINGNVTTRHDTIKTIETKI